MNPSFHARCIWTELFLLFFQPHQRSSTPACTVSRPFVNQSSCEDSGITHPTTYGRIPMNSIIAFYRSSIGKKVMMSLTGLFLIVFLVEHLVGNLLLYAFDNGRMFEAYGAFLVSNPVIRTVEFLLFGSLLFHAIVGTILWFRNRQSRPDSYETYRLEDNTPWASRHTIITGSVVFIFLVIHLKTFFVPSRFSAEPVSGYHLIVQAFANPWYDGFYLVALLILGYHLHHGFQSAFQTLGLRNKKYTPFLDAVAFLVWFVIPFAFATIPVVFNFFHPETSAVLMGAH
jgi:succinate dehydrogenase / fumarate reductase, cytochrome b subunit